MLPWPGPDKVSSARTLILLLYATKKTTLCIGEMVRVPQIVNPSVPSKVAQTESVVDFHSPFMTRSR
jgi:hypothetical protein